MAGPANGQSAPAAPVPPAKDQQADSTGRFELPVSLDRIRAALEQPPLLSLSTIDAQPTFRVEILERQRIEDLLTGMKLPRTYTPAGGVDWNDIQRLVWPPVDNPLVQPYAAYGPGELTTVVIENLAGKYLIGKALGALGHAEREHAPSAARREVKETIRDFCAAQPNAGAGIQICATSPASR